MFVKALRFYLCLVTLLFMEIPQAAAIEANLLALPNIRVDAQQTGDIGVVLTNSEPVEAGQFRLSYDSSIGFQITGVSSTPRTEAYPSPVVQIDASNPRNVEVLLIFYSLQDATILPGTGEIFSLHYQTSANVFGTSPLILSETIFTNVNLSPLPIQNRHGEVSTPHSLTLYISNLQKQMDSFIVPEPISLVGWLTGILLICLYTRRTR